MSSEQRKSKLKSEFDSFGRDGHRSYFPRPHSTGWLLAILTAIFLLTLAAHNSKAQVMLPAAPPVPGNLQSSIFRPELSSAAIGPAQVITNQIDWFFVTNPSPSLSWTAFIEVSTNIAPPSQWVRIAAAPYPPDGGWLHSAFISRPGTFISTRAGYYLNNPTK
jgi:hypothetical protein